MCKSWNKYLLVSKQLTALWRRLWEQGWLNFCLYSAFIAFLYLLLNMLRNCWVSAIVVGITFLKNGRSWSVHGVVLQRTTVKCNTIYNARATLWFCRFLFLRKPQANRPNTTNNLLHNFSSKCLHIMWKYAAKLSNCYSGHNWMLVIYEVSTFSFSSNYHATNWHDCVETSCRVIREWDQKPASKDPSGRLCLSLYDPRSSPFLPACQDHVMSFFSSI